MDKAPPERDAPMLVVAAALIDPLSRVLVQQRAASRSMAGLWEFPGGKVEAGEHPGGALARELEEELGIAVAEDALAPAAFSATAQGARALVLLLYGCRVWKGEPRPLDAAALRWCDIADLGRLAMPPADLPLLDPLARWISAA
jgi:8-oxo-dGTP diphosphatase